MKERTFLEDEQARRVRQRVALFWEKCADLMHRGLAAAKKAGEVPHELISSAKVVSDQIRRDFRLEGEPAREQTDKPAPTLAGLRVVSEEDEAA